MTIGNRLVSRSLVKDADVLPRLTAAFPSMLEADIKLTGSHTLVLLSNNVTHAAAGK
jgi:hypothetical protein